MENWKQQTIEADLEIIVLRNRIEELSKYEALYAEARESLCSCNHTDTPEKGWEYNYTCEWCEQHPEGAEAPDVIKRMWAMEERNSSLVEGIRKLADELHERASREYCSYVEQMRREECLGWEAKIEAGQEGHGMKLGAAGDEELLSPVLRLRADPSNEFPRRY